MLLQEGFFAYPNDGEAKGVGRRHRPLSIDMGLFYHFQCEVKETALSQSSQLLDSHSQPRRRVRTLTDGIETEKPHQVVDPTIPILWERSNRTSTVLPVNLVKQPLSDIDRYSMVEGVIS